MQQTYQDRLHLNATELRWLGAFGDLYGHTQRSLYTAIAKGENAAALKPLFCAEYGLSSRQFNALSIELAGKISSTVELLKLRKKELKSDIEGTTRALLKIERDSMGFVKSPMLTIVSAAKAAKKAASKSQGPALVSAPAPTTTLAALVRTKAAKAVFSPTPKQIAKWRLAVFKKERRLTNLREKAKRVDARLKAQAPGICFGSRKLFQKQFHLEKTSYGTGAEGQANWRKEWRASRSHQFFLVGSKDETGGNQSCKASVHHAPPTTEIAARSTLSLVIKMPHRLVSRKGAPAFLTIHDVHFEYGNDQVLAALRNGAALSYRFHRDDSSADGWRVFVSTDRVDVKKSSMPKNIGMLGVDFNADHLAWARTDRFGNMVDFGRSDLPLHGKSSGQRDAILSNALDAVFAIAQKHSIGLAIEDLDFSKKKQELRSMGVKRARMLAGLAYAKYKTLAEGKESRLGIDLYVVDPAYTSVAGSVKYASRQGCTVHQAAAGAIARRAQGYLEKLPRSGAQRAPLMGRTAVLTLPARNRCESTRTSWASIRKCLTQHCAEQVRLRKKSSTNRGSIACNVVSTHLLDARTSAAWEPGELLARRESQIEGMPF